MAGKQAVYDVFTRFRIDAKNWDKNLNKLSRSLTRTGRNMSRAGANLTKNLTLPLALAGGAAVKFAIDLEQSFAKIQNLVGVSTETLAGFTKEVRRISDTTGEAQKSLADALFVITSAGERGADAIKILEQAAKGAAVGLGETKEIARTVTAVLQAYGKENISAARATDVFFSIVREGNLEAETLAGALGPVIALASKLGVSFEEVGANIATFTRLGVSAEQAATSLQAIFSTFLKPTDGAKTALKEFGLTAAQVRDSIAKNGLADTLIDLVDRVGDNDEALGQIIPNIRALRGVLGTAGVQAESYSDILRSIATNTDLVDKGFRNVSQTAGQKFKVALTNLQNVAIELGNILIPIIIQIVQKATQLINIFKGFSDSTKRTIVQVALLVAALGPALFIFGKIIVVLGTVVKLFTALSLSMIIVVAKVLAIVAAVAALIVIGISLYKNWEKIKNLLVGIMERMILSVFKQAQLFINIWDNVKKITKEIVTGILIRFIKFAKGFTDMWTTFLKKVGLDSPFEKISDNFDAIIDKLEKVTPQVEKPATRLEKTIENLQAKIDKTTVKGLFFDAVKGQVEETGKVIDGVIGSVQKFKNAFSSLGGGTGTSVVAPEGGQRTNALSGLGDISRQDSGITGNELIDKLGGTLEKIKVFGAESKKVFVELTETVQSTMVDLAVSIGEGLGNLVTSGGGFSQFFNSLLLTVTDFAAQFGKVLVSMGVAALALKTVAINPIAAIAAGTALIALAGIAKNLLSKGPDAPSLAVGTNFVTQDGLANLHRGEQVVPAGVRNGGFSGGGGMLVADTQIKGGDIYLVWREEQRKRENT